MGIAGHKPAWMNGEGCLHVARSRAPKSKPIPRRSSWRLGQCKKPIVDACCKLFAVCEVEGPDQQADNGDEVLEVPRL